MTTIKKQTKETSRKQLSRLLIVQGIIMIIAIILIAIVVLQAIPYKKKLDKEIAQKKLEIQKLDDEKKNLTEQLAPLRGAFSKIDQNTAKTALESMVQENPDSVQVVPRIYIHIFANEQRNKAKEISNELSRTGFIVPGVQRVPDRPVQISVVRYFRSQDKSEAARIDSLLSKMIKSPIKIAPIGGYETKVQPRYFEIWFSPDAFKD